MPTKLYWIAQHLQGQMLAVKKKVVIIPVEVLEMVMVLVLGLMEERMFFMA